MTLKKKISMTEFQKLKKEYPEESILAIYTPIPDEEWEEWKYWQKNFKIPDFLKQK